MSKGNHRALGLGLTLALGLSGTALAGAPMLYYTGSDLAPGTPYAWAQGEAIEWNADQGSLGPLAKGEADALVGRAFEHWAAVATADLSARQGADLPVDVNGANFLEQIFQCDGRSPVVYDDDGGIIQALFGQGAECIVLGFAGPECLNVGDPTIIEGVAVIGGAAMTVVCDSDVTEAQMEQATAHEFGHMLNFSHSQGNGNHVLYQQEIEGYEGLGVPSFDDIELMYPYVLTSPEPRVRLVQRDDEAWASYLYPAPDLTWPTLKGTVYQADGTSRLSGVNVIARDPLNPFQEAVSAVSGFKRVELSWPSDMDGEYEMTVSVEE